MLKRIFLLLIVVMVLSLQSLQRGWILLSQIVLEKIGSQILGLFEEPQIQHILREIVQGRNSVILFYVGIVFLGLLSKIFIVEVQKHKLEAIISFK